MWWDCILQTAAVILDCPSQTCITLKTLVQITAHNTNVGRFQITIYKQSAIVILGGPKLQTTIGILGGQISWPTILIFDDPKLQQTILISDGSKLQPTIVILEDPKLRRIHVI